MWLRPTQKCSQSSTLLQQGLIPRQPLRLRQFREGLIRNPIPGNFKNLISTIFWQAETRSSVVISYVTTLFSMSWDTYNKIYTQTSGEMHNVNYKSSQLVLQGGNVFMKHVLLPGHLQGLGLMILEWDLSWSPQATIPTISEWVRCQLIEENGATRGRAECWV